MADTKVSMRRKWAKEVINVGRFYRLRIEVRICVLSSMFQGLVETYRNDSGQSERTHYGSCPRVQGYAQADIEGVIGHVGARDGDESIVNA